MTTITALPTSPSRQDPANFSARGDAFLAALPVFVTETNTVAGEVNANAVAADASADAALISETNSAASATLALSAVTSVSVALGLTVVAVTGTSQSATAGNLYVLQNAAKTTVTLPASPADGDVIGIIVANARIDNEVARNGKQIQGLSENLTLDYPAASIKLRSINSTSQWRIF